QPSGDIEGSWLDRACKLGWPAPLPLSASPVVLFGLTFGPFTCICPRGSLGTGDMCSNLQSLISRCMSTFPRFRQVESKSTILRTLASFHLLMDQPDLFVDRPRVIAVELDQEVDRLAVFQPSPAIEQP